MSSMIMISPIPDRLPCTNVVGRCGVSADKTNQNKPVPFWQVENGVK